jgi:hypothetical protein
MTNASAGSSVERDDRRVPLLARALENPDREGLLAVERCRKPVDAARHSSIDGAYLAATRRRGALATLRPTQPCPSTR